MGLETVTHISDLVATNPLATDQVSQADDHIRNIKTALKTDLPNISGVVNATHTQLNNMLAPPCFGAYQSIAQSINSASSTKVQFQTEEFDTAAAFDNATNYRFTPLVAGYYQVNWSVCFATSVANFAASLYKNGVRFKDGSTGTLFLSHGSAIVQMNGTTDFLEVFATQQSGGAVNTSAAAAQTYFNATLVRLT